MRTACKSLMFAVLSVAMAIEAKGVPIGTAFTYQGRLERPAGTPLTDTCDFEFVLWDESVGGNQLGLDSATAFAVTNGIFSLPLDFGSNVFGTAARWLEVKVKCTGDPSFVSLTPRVELTPVPYALALPGVTSVDTGPVTVRMGQAPSNCCVIHGWAGCDDATCESTVCSIDPFCCNNNWDSICVQEATTLCTSTICDSLTPTFVGIGTTPLHALDVNGNIRSRGADIMLNGRGGGDGNNGGAGRALVDCGDGTQLPGCRGLLVNFSNDYGVVTVAGKVIFPDSQVGIGIDPLTHPLEMASGAHCTAGGAWTNASDRNLKENFASLDSKAVLELVLGLPISSWNYKNEPPSVRHVGPVAQDFQALFGLGGDEHSIATIDADGVALAAIQGLHSLVQERDCKIDQLETQNHDLQKRIESLEKALLSVPHGGAR